MLPALASRIALRKRALPSGSPPPERAATVISLINFVNSLPRLASSAPFLCLILCHFECPDISLRSFWKLLLSGLAGWEIYHDQRSEVRGQSRLITQALHWDRGRPARHEHRQVRGSWQELNFRRLFALRAHCGRDARGPSEELELF